MGGRMQVTAPSQFSDRVPKQVQRCLPLYIIIVFLLFFLGNFESLFPAASSTDLHNIYQNMPYTPTHRFPKKIWQSWKVAPLNFAERDLTVAKTWADMNQRYRYEVLTDGNDMQYVEDNFGPDGFNRPDIVQVYQQLTAKIIKADLLRYLVIYVEGGVYADIDVEALKPVDKFIPERYNETDIDLIIGVEIDEPDFNHHPILGKKSQSFCQWTFVAKPRHPVMMRLVDSILQWLRDVAARQKKPISDIVLDFDEVISGTGPSAFTIAVLAEMSQRLGRNMEWDTFHRLSESKTVAGMLILTVEAFAAGQGHSDSGSHNSRNALVKHHYHASKWPKNHPRYSHPVYGEVESCNWNKECVAEWDANKVAFEKLSPEDQDKEIERKKAIDVDISVVELREQLERIGVKTEGKHHKP